MSWRVVTAIACLAAWACGDPGLAVGTLGPEGMRSGRRLRAVFVDAGGGARHFVGIRDSGRGESCSFDWDRSTRTTRCLPDWGDLPNMYRDAACTQRVYRVDETAGAGRRYFARTESECEYSPWLSRPVVGFWRLGDEVPLDRTYSRSGGECTSLTGGPTSGYHELVRVPLDEFVSGAMVEDGSGRIGEVAIEGDDGSRWRAGLVDRDLDSLCSLAARGDEPAPCRPWAVEWLGDEVVFADEGCSAPLFVRRSMCEDVTPTYGLAGGVLYHLGDPTAPDQVYVQDGSGCHGVRPRPENVYLAPGDPLPAEVLASATLERVDSAGRLQPYDWILGDLRIRRGARYHDRDLDVECAAGSDTEGATRCLPVDPAASTYYLDPQCERQILLTHAAAAPRYSGVCLPPGLDVAGCYWEIHEVGGEVDEALYHRQLGGDIGESTCVPVSPDGLRSFALGGVVPPERFAGFRRVTE